MTPVDQVIITRDIHRTYGTGEAATHALRGVSLVIHQGDFLIITGRNGSGKSTLLHQLGLLDLPDSGDIFLHGQEVSSMRERERCELRLKSLGYIFQEFALIGDLTALENVMLPALMLDRPSRCRRRARELLSAVDLDRQLDHLPSQLSGGEQQKVAIARALINDPAVLFADEPTANLDSIAAGDVLEVFRTLNREEGHTIVMITHEAEETSYGNRVITLSDGLVVGEG